MSDTTADDRGSNESEIVRRKFSLPKKKADRIQALANEHYAGNQSQLVRSAIEDHAHTLEGRGRTLLREAIDEVKNIREMVDEQRKILNEGNSDPEQPSATGVTGVTSQDTVESEVGDHAAIQGNMWPVYRRLADAYPTALPVDELVSSGDLSETDVKHALIDLHAREKIVSSSVEGMTQYRITTDESE